MKKKDLRLLPLEKRPKPSTGQSAPYNPVEEAEWTLNQKALMRAARKSADMNGMNGLVTIIELQAVMAKLNWGWRDVSNVVRYLVRSRWLLRTDDRGIYKLGDGSPPKGWGAKMRAPRAPKEKAPKKEKAPTEHAKAHALKEKIFEEAYARGLRGAALEKETGLAHGFVQRRQKAREKKEEAA